MGSAITVSINNIHLRRYYFIRKQRTPMKYSIGCQGWILLMKLFRSEESQYFWSEYEFITVSFIHKGLHIHMQ